jgi:hypothetical protein
VVTVGDTFNVLPEPIEVPPHVPAYHFQLAPVPKVPPLTVRTTSVPVQVVSSEALMLLAANESAFSVIILLTQAVLPHIPSART